MNRIHWSGEEQELVIEAMVEHLRTVPRARYAELWVAGNSILTPDRRRQWQTAYSGPQSKSSVVFREARKRAATVAMVEPVLPAQKGHMPLQQETPVTWVPVPTADPPLTAADLSFEVLLTEVIKRVMARFAPIGETQTPSVPDKELTRLRKATEVFVVPERAPQVPRPVRIALCGPMADQFRRVKERINARKVELVWVDNQKSVTEQDFSRGLDHVVVTRFIRHSHTELAQQAVGKERVHWTSQGTESIVAAVQAIVPGCVN